VEKVGEHAGEGSHGDPLPNNGIAEHRATLARLYLALPTYGSTAFWRLLEGGQEDGRALPLEMLVKVLREALASEDKHTERRLFEIIIARLQRANEQWVKQALASTRLLADEQQMLAADLYADLCEHLLRVLRDPEQRFWEEHFQHSLRFARKHVYERFMRLEGHWQKLTPGPGKRVPHTLVGSLERAEWRDEFDEPADIYDERAEEALLAVEREDLIALVMRLPAYLRAVVWLVFWEGHTMKSVGGLLNVSERTVRNRLRVALAELRQALTAGQEVVDGRSA
jgi:RNA polymerase sigma factor (sigma-70 family)